MNAPRSGEPASPDRPWWVRGGPGLLLPRSRTGTGVPATTGPPAPAGPAWRRSRHDQAATVGPAQPSFCAAVSTEASSAMARGITARLTVTATVPSPADCSSPLSLAGPFSDSRVARTVAELSDSSARVPVVPVRGRARCAARTLGAGVEVRAGVGAGGGSAPRADGRRGMVPVAAAARPSAVSIAVQSPPGRFSVATRPRPRRA